MKRLAIRRRSVFLTSPSGNAFGIRADFPSLTANPSEFRARFSRRFIYFPFISVQSVRDNNPHNQPGNLENSTPSETRRVIHLLPKLKPVVRSTHLVLQNSSPRKPNTNSQLTPRKPKLNTYSTPRKPELNLNL